MRCIPNFIQKSTVNGLSEQTKMANVGLEHRKMQMSRLWGMHPLNTTILRWHPLKTIDMFIDDGIIAKAYAQWCFSKKSRKLTEAERFECFEEWKYYLIDTCGIVPNQFTEWDIIDEDKFLLFLLNFQ